MIPIARPLIKEEEKKAVLKVLDSGSLAQGTKVTEFQDAFAKYIGTRYAIATNNGTTALHSALLALGVSNGDEIITTPFTFIATANAILYCSARPIFADIDNKTFNIDPESIVEKISPKTKAILIVHLYGQPCNMDAITDICNEHDLMLVEDACQAHGAEYDGRKVGSFGDCAVFSFYPTKNMTTGEGGIVTTNNEKIADKVHLIKQHGRKTRYYHEVLGYNYRMTDIAAAIGIEQLKKLDWMNERRIENARALTKVIKRVDGLGPPYVPPGIKHVFHQYTIRVLDELGLSRDELSKQLRKKGIGTGVYYPIPIHKQPLYQELGYNSKLPEAEEAAKEVLSLPVHQSLTKEELNHLISCLKEL